MKTPSSKEPMTMTSVRMVLVGALTAASCATSTAARNVAVESPKVVQAPAAGEKRADPGPAPISTKAKLLFEDGVKSMDAQKKAGTWNYAPLEAKFKAALETDGNLAEAAFNLGVLAEKQGKTKDAIRYYKDALSRKPSLHQAAENLAVIAQNQGDEAGAIAIYQDILQSYPDDGSSRARLAEVYRRKGDCEKAVELSKEALFREPKTLAAYKVMMQCHIEKKEFSMARLVALRALKLEESDPEIFYALGLINLAEKEPAKARVQFKKAIAARADFTPAHVELVKMAFASEDYKSAEESLRRILQVAGNNLEANLDLGVAYKGIGQLDKAMEQYDSVHKMNPSLPAVYLNKGIVIALKGDHQKAIDQFKQYISLAGGEGALAADHPVFRLIRDQETAIAKKEDEKKALEEAKKMEEEAKRQADAMMAEEKAKKAEEFQKKQAEARGETPKPPAPAPEASPPSKDDKSKKKKDDAKPAETKAPEKAEKKEAKKPGASDEPSDGL